MAARGYAAIGLDNPKNSINVGSALRAAGVYGAAFVAASGSRLRPAMTDTDLNIAIARARGRARPRDMRDYGSNGPWGRDPNGKYNAIPTYTADPREWAKLLEEMRAADVLPTIDPSPDIDGWRLGWCAPGGPTCNDAPTLGRAVAEAWLACNDARSGEGE